MAITQLSHINRPDAVSINCKCDSHMDESIDVWSMASNCLCYCRSQHSCSKQYRSLIIIESYLAQMQQECLDEVLLDLNVALQLAQHEV
jgi:hypothetical protein